MGITTAPAPAGAGALDDDSPVDSVLEDKEEDEGLLPDLSAWASAARGAVERFVRTVTPDVIADRIGSEISAEAAAANVSEYYNDHNASIEAWVNDRTNASTDHDVVEITWYVDGEEATRYLVATVENDSYVNSNMVTDTNRTVDETVGLCGLAARDSRDELESLHETFIGPGENVSRDRLANLATTYGPDVRTSLLESADGCEEVAS